MLAIQCALAAVVILADLPDDIWQNLPGAAPRAPDPEVRVTPGDQTRRFEPRQLPSGWPAGPGFPQDAAVPPSLTFTAVDLAGHEGALLLTGAIANGDARRFQEHLAAMAEAPLAIALHSPGGIVDEALDIGRTIREAGLTVIVAAGASCFSACPYILAAGQRRIASTDALVGVHQHYFGENTLLPAFLAVSDVQAGQGAVMVYLDEMGIDPRIMVKALTTRPDDIYIFLPEELQSFGLVTEMID
jgi:hypothetical protein